MVETIALFAPLVGFILAALLSKKVSDHLVQIISCGMMVLAAVTSVILFVEVGLQNKVMLTEFWKWFDVPGFKVSFGVLLDRTSVTMMAVVNVISCLIHIYSVGYMHHDNSIPRFMGYLSLFTFFMLALVSAPNLVQMFLGWEGVGLASYLLIGFWFHKPSANAASIKAFVMNRIGDAGLIIGLAGLFFLTHTLDIREILVHVTKGTLNQSTFSFLGMTFQAVPFICIALFLGVMGKSAQIGLHTWLPDAMEGPTPVSALIHAATMVTAGVYLLIRLNPLFAIDPHVQQFIAIMGAITCVFAATVGLVQDDIKRIIAYSTCSQLGYMVFAAGLGAVGASFFHLVTHAFFKALLFLGAGSVIHALSDEQNIENMGGLYKHIPFTYGVMWVGSLALAGIPFFAGFYSKDSILASTYASPLHSSHFVYWIGIFVAFMTALYSWRLLIKVFHGDTHADERVMAHVHESPWVMKFPLLMLAIGSVILGYVAEPFFMGEAHPHVPSWVMQAPTLAGIFGISLAFVLFHQAQFLAFSISRRFKYIYLFFLNKWFFDKMYNRIFVQGGLTLSNFLWSRIDAGVIDRFLPGGAAFVIERASMTLRAFQTGYLYHYVFVMILGVVVTLLYVFWGAWS